MTNIKQASTYYLDVKELLVSDTGAEETKKISLPIKELDEKEMDILEPVEGEVDLEMKGDRISATFHLKTRVELACQRCLAKFPHRVELNFTQDYLLPGEKTAEKDDVTLNIKPDRKIEIWQPIRQEILLSLPVKILCKEDCMGLCTRCGGDLNDDKCKCNNS